MKRYILFAGDFYYPSQAWGDFVSASDDLEAIQAEGLACLDEQPQRSDSNWFQVVDLETLKIVAHGKQDW